MISPVYNFLQKEDHMSRLENIFFTKNKDFYKYKKYQNKIYKCAKNIIK